MEKSRKCKYCENTYSIEKFSICKVIGDKAYRRWKCDSCYVGRKAERRKEIRSWLNDYKSKLKCKDCGMNDFRCIEFHHIDDNKSFNIGDAVKRGLSREAILKEIDKCVPLCANCHRIETWNENNRV